MLDLIEQILSRAKSAEAVAVCLVAKTRGSTPQKAGAMMLVFQNGQTLGTLGGGCVEAEVKTRALKLMQSSEDRLLTFQLDRDYGWDDGLVCGGTMDIAVQIVNDEKNARPWRFIHEQLNAGNEATIAFHLPNEKGEMVAIEHALLPRPMLIIAGAGHVGSALATIGNQIGFDVTVIDDRADYATSQRFANAKCIVGSIEAELARLAIHHHTYIVIVTRGHRHDAQALAAVVNSPARYVGLIGSKRKIITIFRDLHAQGISVEKLSRVHAPIGLDIGAITPGEIAVSIASELIAARREESADVPNMKFTPETLKKLLHE
jgi:xanthine dehydrogenase accessory factor